MILFYLQLDDIYCGFARLRMVVKYYSNNYSLQGLRSVTHNTGEGSSLLGLSEAAKLIGFKTLEVKVSYQKLKEEVPFPCIAHWNQTHFVVIYEIKRDIVTTADAAFSLICGKSVISVLSLCQLEYNTYDTDLTD